MANCEDKIRQLYRDFVSEWKELYPLSPTPPVRAICNLRFNEDDCEGKANPGVPFDEWLSSGAATQLENSLRSTEEKISQLKDQLARKVFLHDFLRRLLQCLDDPGVQRSPGCALEKSADSVSVSSRATVSLGLSNRTIEATGKSRCENTSFCSVDAPAAVQSHRARVNHDSVTGTPITDKQTTGLPSPDHSNEKPTTHRELTETCRPSRVGLFVTHDTEQDSGQCRLLPQHGEAVFFAQGANSGNSAVKLDREIGPYESNRPRQKLLQELGDDCNSARKCRACDDRKEISDAAAKDKTAQVKSAHKTAGTKLHLQDTIAGAPYSEYSAHLSAGKRTAPVYGAESSTSATQTEISFNVKEEWIWSSTDADDFTMFKNRKKPNGKRSDKPHDRDNSGIFGRYSDDTPEPAIHTPLHQSASLGVQYLKLTDGFDLTLGTSSDSKSSNQSHQTQEQRKSDPSHSDRETPLARPTDGSNCASELELQAGRQSVHSTLESQECGKVSADGDRAKEDPIANVTPANGASYSPPRMPRDHAPVSRVSSDTTSFRSATEIVTNRPSVKPQPQPRKKLPPLPAKQKPSAVFYVDSVARQSPTFVAARSNNDGVQKKGVDNADEIERIGAGGRKPGDVDEVERCKGALVESGRGHAINVSSRPDVVHTGTESEARGVERVQSGSTNAPCLNASSSIVNEFVPSTSVRPAHDKVVVDQEPSIATFQTASSSTKPLELKPAGILLSAPTVETKPKPYQAETVDDKARAEALAKHRAETANEHGVSELCRTIAIDSLKINPLLSASAANSVTGDDDYSGGGTPETVGYSVDSSEMLNRIQRHTMSRGTKNEGGELPAVYRKTDLLPSPALGDPMAPPTSSATAAAAEQPRRDQTRPLTPRPDYNETDPNDTAFTSRQIFYETDIDSETTVSFAVLRERSPPQPPPKPRKRPRENAYENWTIDRAITHIVDWDSIDDEEDDDDSDTASPGCTLDRVSTKGSKDSGLCLDVHSPVAMETVGADAEDQKKEGQLKDGRIRSLDELNRLHDDEDDETVNPPPLSPDSPGAQDDNISIASDIMYIPSSEVIGSPEDKYTSPDHLDAGPYGNQRRSSTSDDEEEQESPRSVDSSYDDFDAETGIIAASPRDNMLKMRHLLVMGVLETELTYLGILELLIHYKRTLEASCRTSQPVISDEDISSIFSNLHELHNIHKSFVEGLQSRVKNWSPDQTIGDVFKCLVLMFPTFSKYAENYKQAVATIHRCSQESQRFQELAQQIVLTSTTREVTSLEDALFKPVQRLQRNTLVLHDLIKHTPEDHPDFEVLQKAQNLSQHNLENFGTSLAPGSNMEEKRHLVKSSFLVELVSGWRKLRFIFLFSDVLVCTKREQNRTGKVSFDCKWYIPMSVLKIDTKFAYQDDLKFSKKDEIDDLKKKIKSMKADLKSEMKKEESREKYRNSSGKISSRTVEKIKKKIHELEAQLIMASPRLPFKVWHDTGKVYTLLMTTDYEREEWREIITSLRRRSTRGEIPAPSAFDLQEMVNSVRELPQVNKLGFVLTETDEEVVYGTLNVTIHKMNGLTEPSDTYCCLEMDSYGHFFMKARTHICNNSADPSWNEDFELELEGSQTLRILCYKKGPDKEGDILLGRGALEMSKEWLKGTFQEKTVVMNEYCLVLSVRYTAAEKTMRRTPSKQSTAVFGTKISACAKREGKTVPIIVTACVQEVEKRGIDDMGIYRVSGVTSDIQKLKKQFDKNVKVGVSVLSDWDIHSVTGVLKLYFRELPEPLFTENSYSNFTDALKLTDEVGKEKCMLSLFHHLPDINYYTAVYLLEHLYRVSRHEKENKMSIHNLSTIFGPTLLAPAAKDTALSMPEMMSLGAEQCMKQSAVIYYFLNFLNKGGSLRRSSSPQSVV